MYEKFSDQKSINSNSLINDICFKGKEKTKHKNNTNTNLVKV